MISFEALEQLKKFDYDQMRVLPVDGGAAASDEAIKQFVKLLNQFFSQADIKNQSHDTLLQINNYFKQIIDCISDSEYKYYLKKYESSRTPNFVGAAKHSGLIKNIDQLTERMQYWARTLSYSDDIRNIEKHRMAVNSLQKFHNSLTIALTKEEHDSIKWPKKRLFVSTNDTNEASESNPESSKKKPFK